jgi:hypothetical protein
MSQDAFLDEMPRRSVSTVWVSGGCTSYYRTRTAARQDSTRIGVTNTATAQENSMPTRM